MLCFNPKDLVANIDRFMAGEEMIEMVPYYRGFNGQIKQDKNGKVILPKAHMRYRKIVITELPVGMWTDKYKEFLETLVTIHE